jgi:hypothetical protein
MQKSLREIWSTPSKNHDHAKYRSRHNNVSKPHRVERHSTISEESEFIAQPWTILGGNISLSFKTLNIKMICNIIWIYDSLSMFQFERFEERAARHYVLCARSLCTHFELCHILAIKFN